MALGESYRIAGDWFYITFIENNGMAFGLELGGDWGKIALSVFRILFVGLMTYYLLTSAKSKKLHPGLVTSFAFIVAGAIGNIIDSVFYGVIFNSSFAQVASFLPAEGGYSTFLMGKVVDMLYFPIIESTLPNWLPFWGGESFIFFSPVFNIADTAITTGVGIFLIYQKHFFLKEEDSSPKL
jgi:signal peptidase II